MRNRILNCCGLTGTQEDVETAVNAASEAYDSWSKLPGHVRARHLYSIARHVQKHARYRLYFVLTLVVGQVQSCTPPNQIIIMVIILRKETW